MNCCFRAWEATRGKPAHALLATAVALLLHGAAQAQTLVPDNVSCPSCQILVRTDARLGTADGPGSLLGIPGFVGVDAQSRFWVMSWDHLPLIFDRTGRFVRELGRQGAGPQEFGDAASMFTIPGDSIVVLDPDNGRVAVVSPDLRITRTMRMPARFNGATVNQWPGTVLLRGRLTPRSRANPQGGPPLHIASFIADQVTIRSSFGIEPGEGEYASRINSSFRAGSAWIADPRRYRLQRIAGPGQTNFTLERKPAWFAQPSPSNAAGGARTPPSPVVRALEQDPDGLLWVFIHVPADTWREAWPRMPEGVAELNVRDFRDEKLYRTIIEVIDPVAARVVVRHELNSFVAAALPNRRAALYEVGPDDSPMLRIVTFSISGAR
jgi:hypothetical protein